MISEIKVYKLDWNPSTVEGYIKAKNEIYLVFNFDVRVADNWDNAIQYVVGRVVWVSQNFPARAKISISFDFRGQGIIASRARTFKGQIMTKFEFVDIENSVSIDFLI